MLVKEAAQHDLFYRLSSVVRIPLFSIHQQWVYLVTWGNATSKLMNNNTIIK